MGRTSSTTHRWHFCRALYLQPSISKFITQSRNLRHIPKSRPLKAVLFVLSLRGLFCDAPHLTASDKKLGAWGWYSLVISEFKEISEVRDTRDTREIRDDAINH